VVPEDVFINLGLGTKTKATGLASKKMQGDTRNLKKLHSGANL